MFKGVLSIEIECGFDWIISIGRNVNKKSQGSQPWLFLFSKL